MEDLYEFTRQKITKTFHWSDLDPWKGKEPTDEEKKKLYVVPKLLGYGDYDSSCAAERSNYRVFLEKFGKVDGVHELHDYMGSTSIAIRVDVAEGNEEIKDILDGLEQYPVIDVDDQSNMEQEMFIEAWKDWVRSDACRAVVKLLDGFFDDPETTVDDTDETALWEMFTDASSDVGEYFEVQAGGSVWIRLDNVVPAFADLFLVRVMEPEQLPLLVSREWKSDRAKNEYQSLLKKGAEVT